ncbi:MAG: glycosyl transferase family 1 [Actinomycetia bacterium]|nr:glycosyl transferase family 1 [Actinomycetes bacterium]
MVGLPGIGRFITGLWSGLGNTDADVVGLWPGTNLRHWLGEHHFAPAGRHVKVRARPFLPVEQVTVPLALRRLDADVHHATHFNVPYAARVPIVLTVYDLIVYLDATKARSRAAGAYYRAAVPRAVRRASVIVALSPFTARQLVETFDVPPERLRVIEAGLDRDRWQPQTDTAVSAVRTRFSVPERYLLYVGTAKRHKNLATLVAAHRSDHPPLVLAGPTVRELASVGIEPANDGRIIVLGRVPDDTLPALYAGALALVLPSLHEGLGLTPLEAMACGTPVVVSDGGALPDTVGEAGVIVPSLDTDAWSVALSRISDDDGLRERLGRVGFDRVATRDWRDCAQRYVDVYREAAAGAGRA